MIEVEKKFQPTEEQLNKLLHDSKFIKEVVNEDIIYDYSDYRLIKKSVRLRNRNGKFELKISDSQDEEVSGSQEIDDQTEIKKYFNIDYPIEEFVHKNLIIAIHIKTYRKKYTKDDFIIDIDELDFGYKCVEIELQVDEQREVGSAMHRIINLAQEYDFEIKEIPPKKREYFRIVKPEVYKQLYENK